MTLQHVDIFLFHKGCKRFPLSIPTGGAFPVFEQSTTFRGVRKNASPLPDTDPDEPTCYILKNTPSINDIYS